MVDRPVTREPVVTHAAHVVRAVTMTMTMMDVLVVAAVVVLAVLMVVVVEVVVVALQQDAIKARENEYFWILNRRLYIGNEKRTKKIYGIFELRSYSRTRALAYIYIDDIDMGIEFRFWVFIFLTQIAFKDYR